MAPKNFPYLHQLMYIGFHGGLKWETFAQEVYDEKEQRTVKKHRFLLHHPHSFHIAKVLTQGLNTKRLLVVSLALSDIYSYAIDNLDLCCHLEPQDFFAYAKNSFFWSRPFRDNAFWAFTYKAFHARAIFLDKQLHLFGHESIGHPMVFALDKFREDFLAMYPTNRADLLEKGDKINQENLEWVEDRVSANKRLHEKYFPYELTHADGSGDGTDKLVLHKDVPAKKYKSSPPIPDNLDMSKVPDEELFYYATECKAKRRDTFKNLSLPKAPQVEKAKDTLQGAGIVRKYDAFKEYRDPNKESEKDEDESKEKGDAGTINELQELDEDDIMGEAWVEDEVPEVKKLKIADD